MGENIYKTYTIFLKVPAPWKRKNSYKSILRESNKEQGQKIQEILNKRVKMANEQGKKSPTSLVFREIKTKITF